MASTGVTRCPHGAQQQHRLLHLDCSADLRSFSRTLGPGVQEKLFQSMGDAFRLQMDSHRDRLLQHTEHRQTPLNRVPELNQRPVAPLAVPLVNVWHPYSHNLVPHHVQVQQQEERRQQHEEEMQQLRQRPQQKQRRTYDFAAGEYPPNLHEALEKCKREGSSTQQGAIYHVMYEQLNEYLGDETEVVGTFRSLHEANVFIPRHLMINCNQEAIEQGTWETDGDGRLRFSSEQFYDEDTVNMYIKIGKIQ
ncbi:hypothetical protein ACN47E_001130 [Coniothyrium glycines]